VWPEDRETVAIGTLKLTELETGRDPGGDILVFDPTRVTDGIELTDDPIPGFRSRADSVSLERRAGASPARARLKTILRASARPSPCCSRPGLKCRWDPRTGRPSAPGSAGSAGPPPERCLESGEVLVVSASTLG
jgi:hypothetical protein